MGNLNFTRWIATSSLILVGFITLGHYTNCAPPPTGSMDQAADTSGDEVRIVDDWYQQEIAFLKTHEEVPQGKKTLVIDGICGRKSQGEIQWFIQGREEIAGVGECQFGGFRIEVSDIQTLECGKTYYLQAKTETNESAAIYLSRNCNGRVSTL
jgi:hypothetical protein